MTPATSPYGGLRLPSTAAAPGSMPRSVLGRVPSIAAGATATAGSGPNARARAQAVDFEAMVLTNLFSQMFTGIDGEGPFGGGGATGVWRSFLTDEYAKSFARSGGIGLADHVYRSLLRQQETAARAHP